MKQTCFFFFHSFFPSKRAAPNKNISTILGIVEGFATKVANGIKHALGSVHNKVRKEKKRKEKNTRGFSMFRRL